MKTLKRALTQQLVVVIFLALSLQATSFYIDPGQGKIDNDGSAQNPWSTLQEVLTEGKIETRMYETKPAEPNTPLVPKNTGAPVKAGDTLLLRTGYHGDIYAREFYNEDYITIMAQSGHKPTAAHLELRSGCKWIVSGLTISPTFAAKYEKKTLIQFSSHSWTGPSWDCVAENCIAYSAPDASVWTRQEWDTLPCHGMSLPGKAMVCRNNHFKNVAFGITVSGDSCLVEYNRVENFSGDGMRGLGNYGVFQYNVIKNCYAVNANHDDGFQSWSDGPGGVGTGVVYGIILRGNTIINFEDPNQPFLGTLQGIGCFDGMFEDWRVENNVVITDHWHGITLSGATNCVMINNTVVDIRTATNMKPWIRIGDHKDGRHSTGCVVRNNLSPSYNCTGFDVTEDHNITVTNYEDYFVDYAKHDLHLKEGCAAIDSGSAQLAPPLDRDRRRRPHNGRIDIGAHEYGAISIKKKKRHYAKTSALTFVRSDHTISFVINHNQPKALEFYSVKGALVFSVSSFPSKTFAVPPNILSSGIYIARLVLPEENCRVRFFVSQ